MSTLVRHENGVTLAVCGSNFAIAHSNSPSVYVVLSELRAVCHCHLS